MDPKRYVKRACEWIGERTKNKEVSADFYESLLRTASAKVSNSLNLEDERVFEHVIHYVLFDGKCGAKYNARMPNKGSRKNPSTTDFRHFMPENIEAEADGYGEHIEARYRAAWERERLDESCPMDIPVAELLKKKKISAVGAEATA